MEYLKLIVGLAVLVYSGHLLVKGGVSLSRHFKVSTAVIGVTVISFGTSAPELIVSLQAATQGYPAIAVGNVIGSNISNIALVLAFTAIIFPVVVSRNSAVFDWPFMMVASILFYLFLMDMSIATIEGIMLFMLLLVYIVWSVLSSRKSMKREQTEIIPPTIRLFPSILIVLAAGAGLAFGSNWLVDGAATIAENLGVSERTISITLIAFGTSVPELATSAIAAFKKEADISIGNIIGSNIFNILAVIGITATITPISIQDSLILSFDTLWMIGISILLFLFMLPLKYSKIGRLKGGLFLLVYVYYIFQVFATG